MEKCSKCGNVNLRMQVPILVNMNAKHESRITKKSIAEKETEIVAASWDRMIITCADCLHIIDNLDKHVQKCMKCEFKLDLEENKNG